MVDAGPKTRVRARSERLRAAGERWLYVVFAAGLTLWVACRFYASMRLQIESTSSLPLASPKDWSGPLDDVFIHFDFARAIARGHPFEWSEGNGYSSGGSSVLYPFVLAVGYWVGFRKLALMLWAALVACVCTFALLLAARRLFRDLPRWTSYLAPPFVLGVGVLGWNLFSGMEVAFMLALWAAALLAWDDLVRGPEGHPDASARNGTALLLGFWGALLVATRPEAAVAVAVFGLSAGWAIHRAGGFRRAATVVALTGLPAVAVLVLHAIANRVLTGDSSAAGALVKLELHHPYLSGAEVWEAWKFHVKYQLFRVAEYHLTDAPGYGWIPFALGLFALVPKSTRRYAVVLWFSAVAWVLVVALNGQVRWQNERYTMPALAWVLLAAALGAGALLGTTPALGRRGIALRSLATMLVAASVGLFAWHQAPRYRDQVWFFGRASRNIRDQHIRTGRLLGSMLPRPPHRVLVGDAGAIPYASDLPALDIIGLGGFRGLPFARATRQSVGAAIELIERIPAQDRPELLALYPSWWGVLPLWFGVEIGEVPVDGNVICGGAAKVLYRADWSALERSGVPARSAAGEQVVDALDPADVVSERDHGYRTSVGIPHIDAKMLPHPRDGSPLFDAGRILPEGSWQRFELRAPDAGKAARLIFRLAPARPTVLAVSVGGVQIGALEVERHDGFIEPALALPESAVGARVNVEIRGAKGEHVLHHVWLVQVR